jgi:5-(carboxyamino)imidazole ribonucleotide synthase
MEQNTILPGSWLALLGGGQLGRMFATAASQLGYRVCVLEPDPLAPAATSSEKHIALPYTDPEALRQLLDQAAAVTTEFENVPADAVELLGKKIPTCPDATSLRITQDRIFEKTFIRECGLQTAPFLPVESEEDCENAADEFFPAILKTARLGYDGKGQIQVASKEALKAAFRQLGCVRCVLEKKVSLALEISVIAARNARGDIETFPVCENHHRSGILATTVMPARIPAALADKAREMARVLIAHMQYRGVLCTEFFVLTNGELVVNEMAPRPHNSGHATIEACETSQYEEQVRAMTNMPLGSTRQKQFAVMLNILGDVWHDKDGNLKTPAWDKILAIKGAHLHLYGKQVPRIGRKMGHVTCTADSLEEALATAEKAAGVLGLPSINS